MKYINTNKILKLMSKTKILEKAKDSSVNVALDTISINKQAIIFVNTKRSAESLAEKIAKYSLENKDSTELSKKITSVLNTPTKQCQKLGNVVSKSVAFHHSGLLSEQRKLIEDNFKSGVIKIIVATPTLAIGVDLPAFRVIIRDLKRFGIWGMEYIPVLEYEQQSGRAGRPSYDDHGEAIIIADSEKQKEELLEKYINGSPEEIISKLASEPILRTYILSLIATEFVSDKKSLEEFFSKTFYAKQYGDTKKINSIIKRMIEQLQDWNFIKDLKDSKDHKDSGKDFISALKMSFNEKLQATPLGKRVSELYLDPYTAHHIIESLQTINIIHGDKQDKRKISDLTYLQILCSCLELRPLLRVKTAEYDSTIEYLNTNEEYFLQITEPYDDNYDDFLSSVKTARFFMEWLEEKDEEFLFEKYDVRPGEINSKKDKADWLFYSSIEISKLLKLHTLIKDLSKLRYRLQYGVKEELIPLLQLKNIGRVRARTMFRNGIKDISDVKKIDFANLSRLLGKNIALDVKKQVGQEFSEEKIKVKENKRKGQINLNDY
ncbi:MAG: helicase-related protein [Candidatus Woesearchaeota archaeon]